MPDRLSGPVDVCVAIPRLEVDRPFTYVLPPDADAGVGSLVSVPFHGRTVRGWILGPAGEVPQGKLLPVRTIRSSIRFFDPTMLRLLRWVAGRYIAPLATVIERSHPPRVASEEAALRPGRPVAPAFAPPSLEAYGGAERLLHPGRTTWLRPLPGSESEVCVAAVAACLAGGRRALVLVPEADPLPATARAVLEAFGDRAVGFLGSDGRERYRSWLQIKAGRFDVVVATRPGVFAPLEGLGLMWISREVHPGHREDRAPYHHVRDVAMARAGIQRAACVLAALSPSVQTVAASEARLVAVARPPRARERRAAPLVETTAPEAEDRSARLGRSLRDVRSAALILSRRGYGVARVCRVCGEPAACRVCRGPIVQERGRTTCRVCGAAGTCAVCGAASFGLERGGTERVAEWAASMAGRPAALERSDEPPPPPGDGGILVGTARAVKDVGPAALDLVAILDPDRALARPGVHAGEQALATWMEASAWARPKGEGGRVLVQTRHPGHPALQALIRWEPTLFLAGEAERRSQAGFPPTHAVFRLEAGEGAPALNGMSPLRDALREGGAETVLETTADGRTLCLVAVPPNRLKGFRQAVSRLVVDGVIRRVEAEPQL